MKIRYVIWPVIALFFLYSCHELTNPLENIDSKNIITLSVVNEDLITDDSLLMVQADSVSSRFIKATLHEKSDAARVITFTTTAGVLTKPGELPSALSERTLTITPTDREVLVQLNALDIPTNQVIVSGTVGSVSSVIQLNFSNSYPENFTINPSATTVDKTDTVTVFVNTFRQSGKVSENMLFDIEVIAPDSIPISFPALGKLNNQQGQFKLINVDEKTGNITVKVKMPVSVDKTFVKTLVINYR